MDKTQKGNAVHQGRIVKGVGGFYYVDTADGYFECRARGSFRAKGVTPLVGDRVAIAVDPVSGTGAIEEILPRENQLLRPPVANISQLAVVVSTANPKPNLYLLDKLLASAEPLEIDIILCINKTDLDQGAELCDIYRGAGFKTLSVSAKDGTGMAELSALLKDKVTAFAGNSGVGKSSILNAVTGTDGFETGEVSDRVERGKHTTRHTELVALKDGGYIIDTPGFGNLDISLIQPESCQELFREFADYIGGCRFRDCRHLAEPDCAILKAVAEGEISVQRHQSYVRLVDEVSKKDKR